ncbi:uncharacterized protein LOC116162724 [Photinus pyralis]|nr:uncharacterized protein LOC116162724 [Photinus pyralis]
MLDSSEGPFDLSTKNAILIDLDGCKLIPDRPKLLKYEIIVPMHTNSVPTTSWVDKFGENSRNLCFYSTTIRNVLEIQVYYPCVYNHIPKMYNVFVNQQLRAVLYIKNIEQFNVNFKSME